MKQDNSLSLLRMLTLVVFGAHANLASAKDLTGVWTLERYEMGGEEQDGVSGLLIMADGRFAMVYTMTRDGDALSGRAHAGRYESRRSELTFDVEQWVQHMDGEGSIVPPERVTAETTLEGGTLVLRFASGSVQRWRRLPEGMESDAPGIWGDEQATEAQGKTADGETPVRQR